MKEYSFLQEISTNTLGALTSGLAIGAGTSNFLKSKKNHWIHIKTCVADCKTLKDLKEVDNHYHIDDGDLWYYVRRYRMPFYEVQQALFDRVDEKIKEANIVEKVGLGVAAAGTVGAAITGPKFYRTMKTGLKNLRR